MKAIEIKERMRLMRNDEKIGILSKFFRSNKGTYEEGGETESFIGLTTPQIEALAKEFLQSYLEKRKTFKEGYSIENVLEETKQFLYDPTHEIRVLGTSLLVALYPLNEDLIYNFYYLHIQCFNNWDLVDRTCYKILGKYLYNLFISSKRTTPRKEVTMKDEITVPALEIQELQMPQGMSGVSTLDNMQSVSNIQIPQVPQEIDPLQVQPVDELTQQNLAIQQQIQNYQNQQNIDMQSVTTMDNMTMQPSINGVGMQTLSTIEDITGMTHLSDMALSSVATMAGIQTMTQSMIDKEMNEKKLQKTKVEKMMSTKKTKTAKVTKKTKKVKGVKGAKPPKKVTKKELKKRFEEEKQKVINLASSQSLWERRIAMVSMMYFIKNGEFALPFQIIEILKTDKTDLIQKAVGWMLREIGKKNERKLMIFLNRNIKVIGPITRSYACEKLSKDVKEKYKEMAKK